MHVGFGYTVLYVPVLMLITCAGAQGGRLVGLTAVLVLITFLQPILVYARDDIPVIAALHPLNAPAITVLGLVIARRATALAALPTLPAPETPELVLPEGWDPVTRICPSCGKRIAANRKRYCNQCGVLRRQPRVTAAIEPLLIGRLRGFSTDFGLFRENRSE